MIFIFIDNFLMFFKREYVRVFGKNDVKFLGNLNVTMQVARGSSNIKYKYSYAISLRFFYYLL